MTLVTRWVGWEALFIHGLTGLLFAGAGSFAIYKLAVLQPWVLALVVPLFAFFAWGWWAEAAVIVRATAWMRRPPHEGEAP